MMVLKSHMADGKRSCIKVIEEISSKFFWYFCTSAHAPNFLKRPWSQSSLLQIRIGYLTVSKQNFEWPSQI